jgi:hypothetical protein
MKTSNPPSRPRRTDAARRAQLLGAFERSGLSAAAFARQHKLNYTTFCAWRQRRAKANSSPTFVEVELPAALAPAGLVIELGRAARMRIESAGQIALAAELIEAFNATS